RAGQPCASVVASSRLSAFTTQKLPSHSRISPKGPSVITPPGFNTFPSLAKRWPLLTNLPCATRPPTQSCHFLARASISLGDALLGSCSGSLNNNINSFMVVSFALDAEALLPSPSAMVVEERRRPA